MAASYRIGRAGELILILTRSLVGITFFVDQKNIVETLSNHIYGKSSPKLFSAIF